MCVCVCVGGGGGGTELKAKMGINYLRMWRSIGTTVLMLSYFSQDRSNDDCHNCYMLLPIVS